MVILRAVVQVVLYFVDPLAHWANAYYGQPARRGSSFHRRWTLAEVQRIYTK
jgi:hypothetical protein